MQKLNILDNFLYGNFDQISSYEGLYKFEYFQVRNITSKVGIIFENKLLPIKSIFCVRHLVENGSELRIFTGFVV